MANDTRWDFDSALDDDLIEVVERMDEMMHFAIRLGDLDEMIFIDLGRMASSDETKVFQSHAIATPSQAGPYRTSRPYYDDPEYALSTTISALTDYYRQAVRDGHEPSEDWLVKY